MKRFVISLFIAVALTAMADKNERQMFSYSQNVEVFSDVLKRLSIHYVDTLDIDKSVK